MSTHSKKRSRKSGLPPGTMVHIGEKKGDAQKVKFSHGGTENTEKTY